MVVWGDAPIEVRKAIQSGRRERRQPMLVPEDDPCNNELVMRLTDEVLFLARPDPAYRQGYGARAGGQVVCTDSAWPARAT
jgi:hypothetical protein